MAEKPIFDGETALCCRNFTLPYSPEEIKERYLECLDAFEKNDSHGAKRIKDILLVYPMLVYLGFYSVSGSELGGKSGEVTAHRYTCKHLDREKGVCTIYDIRPHLCRSYPDPKGHCEYLNCASRSFCNGINREAESCTEKKCS